MTRKDVFIVAIAVGGPFAFEKWLGLPFYIGSPLSLMSAGIVQYLLLSPRPKPARYFVKVFLYCVFAYGVFRLLGL